MKKFFALVLAVLMVFCMTACAGGASSKETEAATVKAETKSAEAAETEAENEDVLEKTEAAEDENSLLAVVKELLGNAVSLSDYELSYEDEESVSLYLLDGERIELDYSIDLGDGTTIQLPMVYGDLLDAGWTNTQEWTEKVESNTAGFSAHTNADGKSIYITVKNHTSETMDLADIWVISVNLGGDYTEEFDIHGISKGASMADVVAAWGLPYHIYYFCSADDNDYASLEFEYSAINGSLSFEFDLETGLVASASYAFSSNYID